MNKTSTHLFVVLPFACLLGFTAGCSKSTDAQTDVTIKKGTAKVNQPTQPGVIQAPANVAAAPADAKRSDSGLAWVRLQEGKGKKHPSATDKVEVHYSGWTTDGKMFDSSVARGQPAKFPLNGVIKGWTEGLQHMVEGEKTRFWIPGKLAYGDVSHGGRPAGTLVFDVELLKINPN